MMACGVSRRVTSQARRAPLSWPAPTSFQLLAVVLAVACIAAAHGDHTRAAHKTIAADGAVSKDAETSASGRRQATTPTPTQMMRVEKKDEAEDAANARGYVFVSCAPNYQCPPLTSSHPNWGGKAVGGTDMHMCFRLAALNNGTTVDLQSSTLNYTSIPSAVRGGFVTATACWSACANQARLSAVVPALGANIGVVDNIGLEYNGACFCSLNGTDTSGASLSHRTPQCGVYSSSLSTTGCFDPETNQAITFANKPGNCGEISDKASRDCRDYLATAGIGGGTADNLGLNTNCIFSM